MEVLFDLQQELETLDLNSSDLIVPVGFHQPTLKINVVDDVKTILVKDRADRISGIGVDLKELPELRAGDRITITGRVPRETPPGSWGVALISEESEARRAEECQLAQQRSPKVLFSLSHILGGVDLDGLIMVQTTRWGAIEPVMNFFVDSIIISRGDGEISVKEDERELVYSLETDENLKARRTGAAFSTGVLYQAGSPEIMVLEKDGETRIYLNERAKEWDGLDINLKSLGILTGNKYQIVATGKVVGNAQRGSRITLQGIPGFSWRGSERMKLDGEFELTHTLSYAEVEQWTTVRITTNSIGASVPFYISGIEVKRLGLL
ncbi:MAG: hypothetical protein FWF77_02615 [Defluviitaleaceae bacterium]|nr:hypothetical protein [Defluviitaleaceae bacterium]